MDNILYLLSILGSAGLVGFIEFLIRRHDKKKGIMSRIEKTLINLDKRVDEVDLGLLRVQLLTLMNHYENDLYQIMLVAEKYFTNGGDWYMSSLFEKFIKEHKLETPIWFKGGNHQ